MSFEAGDRVRVVQIKWLGATPEELATIGSLGTVVPDPAGLSLFVRVELDDKPDWWANKGPIPFVEDELEKL